MTAVHRRAAPAAFSSRLLLIAFVLPSCAAAAEDVAALDEIIVQASPFARSAEELVHPVELLTGEALDRARRGTIGELLGERPGIANASFGPGVGRPVLRGLGSARVLVLDNGIASMDASAISADHAVGLDPLQAEQVEVIKGPATLIYGGGASAGIVNVVDDRLPETVTPGLRLSGDLSYGSNADEHSGALKLRYGSGSTQFGAQLSRRKAGDFAIPGSAERPGVHDGHDHGDEEEERSGVLENSSLDATGYGASFAWIGTRALLGLAVNRFETEYGIPGGHAHGHDHGEDEDEDEAGGHGHEGVRIDLRQTRVDLRGALLAPFTGVERIELRTGVNDYRHEEIEPDGAVGTTFDVREVESRLQMAHVPLGGWVGVAGLQYSDRDFEAVGEEAFVPPVRTRALGLFLVESHAFGDGHRFELGGRLDRVEHRPEASVDAPDRNLDASTLSAGLALRLPEHLHLRLNAQRAQRAPTAEELYAFGPHLATGAFERGDLDLRRETSSNTEISLARDRGRWTWELTAYLNRISDYIVLREVDAGLNADGSGSGGSGGSGGSDGIADRVDEAGTFDPDGELLLLDHRQQDAQLHGFEAETVLALIDTEHRGLALRAFGDTVRGRLRSGENLPRLTPARLGIGADARFDAWSGGVSYLRAFEQYRTAALETPTPGYDLLSADLAYTLTTAAGRTRFYLQGRNLLDEKIRLHTSFLKDVAPQPGISVFAGLRFEFSPAL